MFICVRFKNVSKNRFCVVLLIYLKKKMKMWMTVVEVSLQHHATRSLPIHGITIATGDSSFTESPRLPASSHS